MNLNFGLLLSSLTTFLLGTFRSVLKVNEFTLAGAVLADSLGRGAGKKETARSRLTPRLKARHFQKNTIHPQKPGRIQYAQGTLRPCNPWAMASYCLILVVEIVEVPDRGQEQNSASPPLFRICPVFLENKKGVELNAFTYLRPSTAHNE
ncbi:hypothetical protein [Fibrobacter succinogenes]|uniref:hypothetical protein n=1 Tax=Fibrobacter succinogenes TaxID=833 RepID=UPI001568F15A|nr:hypothetical protein [Fibrobacter succinogenes]